MRRCLLISALALAGVGACSSHTPPAAPAPAPAVKSAPAPDPSAALLGHWTYLAQFGEEQYTGTLDISRDTLGWHARLVDGQRGETPIESVAVAGSVLTMKVQVGEVVTIELAAQPDGTLGGKLLISEGEGTVSAKRTEAPTP